MNVYDVGDRVIITGTFTQAGVATDPATVRARYGFKGGPITTLIYERDAALTKTGTGVYTFDIPITVAGHWHYTMDDSTALGVIGNVATKGEFDAEVAI